jgi:hypothetical protein
VLYLGLVSLKPNPLMVDKIRARAIAQDIRQRIFLDSNLSRIHMSAKLSYYLHHFRYPLIRVSDHPLLHTKRADTMIMIDISDRTNILVNGKPVLFHERHDVQIKFIRNRVRFELYLFFLEKSNIIARDLLKEKTKPPFHRSGKVMTFGKKKFLFEKK